MSLQRSVQKAAPGLRRHRVLTLPENWAELVLDIGECVRRQARRGATAEQIATWLRSTTGYCQLALDFACSSDLLKLRALVEDWSLERVAHELGSDYCKIFQESRNAQAAPAEIRIERQ